MFTLSTKDKFDDLERLIDRFVNMGNAEGRKITDGIRQQFAANFTRQGSGAGRWAALRPSTLRQRIAAGFSRCQPSWFFAAHAIQNQLAPIRKLEVSTSAVSTSAAA